MYHNAHSSGKGDRPRNIDRKKYGESIERIFGPKEIKTWNPDEDEKEEEKQKERESPED